MDRRPGPPRPRRQELRAAASVAGAAGFAAVTPQTCREPGGRAQPAAEAAGDRQLKLASVATDVFGVSGQAMLKALIEGNASVEAMAALAKGRLRPKHDDLVLALDGRVEEHHRFLLTMQRCRLEAAEQDIDALDLRLPSGSSPTASSTLS